MNRTNMSAHMNRDRDYGYSDGVYRGGETLYDGTSVMGPGTPNFKTRATTTTLGTAPSETQPALVSDMLLDLLVAKIRAMAADSIVRIVICAVAAIIYVVSIIMVIMKIFNRMRVPGMVANSGVWRWLQKSPLVVWFIVASVSASLLPILFPSISNMNVYANLVIGALMLIYVIRTWSTCSRYLLAIAAIYLIGVALMQLNMFGVATVTTQGILWNLIYWNALIVYVLSLVDHFIVWPQCG